MSRNTATSMGDHVADFVDGQMRAGRDGTASDVIRAGLRLLEECEAAMQSLREAIDAGERSGPSVAFDFEAFLAGKRRRGVTRVLLTPAAQADLEAIWDDTEGHGGQRQAERYVAAIGDGCSLLAARDYPDWDASDVRPDSRKAVVGSQILYFLRRADGAPEVIRILHQRMDVDRHLI